MCRAAGGRTLMPRQAGLLGQRRWLLAVLSVPALILVSGSAAWGAPGRQSAMVQPAAAAVPATVSVNAAQQVASVPATAIGINGSVYDPNLKDAAVPGLLSSAGVTVI